MHPEVVRDEPGDCPKCGMALEPMGGSGDDPENAELRDLTRRMWIGAALALPVFVVAMTHLIPGSADWHWMHEPWVRWIQFVLSTPVVAWCGAPFFARGWRSLFGGRWNMFTLIMLGVGAAYAFSVVALLAPNVFPESMRSEGPVPLYFEAAAVIVVLVLVGQVMELRARARTSSAIQGLLDLAPPTAIRIDDDGEEKEISLDEVAVGDRLQVKANSKMPVDGVIEEGHSTVDESMVTGESIPVEKQAGDSVTGGTLNGKGSLVIRAEKIGSDTLLSRIVHMVADAQRSRAPIQGLADRVAGWFAPAVVVCAVLTFAAWWWMGPEPRLAFALVNAVAVLIIACPCALGLATPMSIMVGVGRGAQEGVLIRNADALERMEHVDTLVVDKTGTLTEGKPSVTDVIGDDESALLAIAAGLEKSSEHPLASAIVTAAKEREITPADIADFNAVTGKGVQGRVSGDLVRIGKPKWIESEGVTLPEGLSTQIHDLQAKARTVMIVTRGDRALGLIAVADPIKDSTHEAVKLLHQLGIQLHMATGDNRPTAESVAKELGIDHVDAGVTPEDKIAKIKTLQQSGARVAMAGDGVNDAPALAQANVGIAMGTGTDVAMESAGVTLVKGDLRGIAKAIRLSRATMRNIRQNLFFAFAYNALGIPIAAGVLYPFTGTLLSPIIAGLAMSFSSVSVITNALRLRKTSL